MPRVTPESAFNLSADDSLGFPDETVLESVTFPDTVVVEVTERTPILAWRVGDSTFLADRDGVLFALATGGADDGLPSVADGRLGSRTGLSVGPRPPPGAPGGGAARSKTPPRPGIEGGTALSADPARKGSSAAPATPSTRSGAHTASHGGTSWPLAIARPRYSIT